jgi:hypothetical protein
MHAQYRALDQWLRRHQAPRQVSPPYRTVFTVLPPHVFEAVQAKLSEQANNYKATRMKSEALLAGRLFDDRGNRMTPSHVRKRGIKYRYYLSSALLQGQPELAGAVSRVPAAEIEGLVVRTVRDHLDQSAEIEDAVLINTHVGQDRGPVGSVGDRAGRRKRYPLQAGAKPQCAEGPVAQDATQATP